MLAENCNWQSWLSPAKAGCSPRSAASCRKVSMAAVASAASTNTRPDLMLTENDAVLVHGSAAAVETARRKLGNVAVDQIVADRSALDYTRIFVSNYGRRPGTGRPRSEPLPSDDRPYPPAMH
jgi:hypothetical protein